MLEMLDMLAHNNVVQALILVAILWLIAKDEANLNLGNMCALLFFSFAIGWAAVIFLFPHVGIFGLAVKPLIFILLIKYMCWVRYRIAFAATAIYVVVILLLNVALFIGYFFQQAHGDGEQAELLSFAQGYITDQFANEQDWEEGDLYADEYLLEEDVPEGLENTAGHDGARGEDQIPKETAGAPSLPAASDSKLGLNPSNPGPGPAAPRPDEDHLYSRRKIMVTGRFTSAKGEVAMVENEMVGLGETIEVRYKGDNYTWRLARFEKDRITWEPVMP